jgi:NADH:ubiquinone oxidoreductase subunit 5 (subunit L)/multisubunit Na+/H+ antiporter MnhA subunit
VTAGVYLFQRYFYCLTDRVLCYLLVVGLATRVVGGFGALVEPDTKKVIAIRTLSQLGFLTLALGSRLPVLSFTHLLTHAILKRCLFLQVGRAIHAISSSQNSQL